MRRALCVMFLMMWLVPLVQAKYLDEVTDYAQDRFIVKVYPNVGNLDPALMGSTVRVFDPALTALNMKWGVVKVERLFVGPKDDAIAERFDLPGYWRFWVDKPAAPADMEQILAEYASAPLVEHVEPVGIHRVDYSPNDPAWSNQWYIRSTTGDHDIDAVEGWDIERGDTTAILGITDTGVLYNHPDLQAHIWHNWAEVNGTPGVDNDGNGFVDDTVGYDFVSSAEYGYNCYAGEDCSGADADPKDFNGHGTHVSGIAAAVTNNGVGVAGIAGGGGTSRGARIMPLRIGWSANYFGQEAGFVGMDYAAQAFNYGRVKGVCAFNCSWGNDNSGGLGAATDAAVAAGIVVCVAAGNNNDQSASYLGGRTDCIAVAATDNGDIKASFSTYGSWVDVSAPGVSIYSTYSNHYTASYTYLDGTSMATPCVVGEAGLLKSHNPSWTRTQITPAIVNNVDNINALNPGYSGLLGSGRINVNLALLTSASITVTSPNGNEVWYTGESHNITWNSSGVSGNIKIEVNRSYSGGAWETIIASTANTGSYPWIVTTPVTTTARVRISSVNTPTLLDISDNNFTIAAPYVTVAAPNGGETWYQGESHPITWTSGGFTGNVKVELNRTYPGGAWETLFASIANDGSEPWTASGTAGTQMAVRVSSVGTPSINDVSDNVFTIAVPYVTVAFPNGNEIWTIGSSQNIVWTSGGFSGNVKIELNRSYSGGTWEILYASIPNDGNELWTVTGPSSSLARVRISSVSSPAVLDVSDNNFTIAGLPPVLLHDALDDFTVGSSTVTSLASSPAGSISAVRMYYRLAGGATFTLLNLPHTTGNEYAASLSSLSAGSYEYYVEAVDNTALTSCIPSTAPAALYTFTVGTTYGAELAYDDGSAEWFNYPAPDADSIGVEWAVKFGPVQTPFALYGARFAASRILPDSIHTPVRVKVYLADGANGLPGTLISNTIQGSVGNEIGGLPAGTNWARAIFRDVAANPLTINASNFYIAVANYQSGKIEAFGRDTNGANNHQSFVYDPCQMQWFSEDVNDSLTHAGNRLIRAQGFSLVPPTVAIYRDGNDIKLLWNSTGAPAYKVYNAANASGPFAFVQATADTFLTVSNSDSTTSRAFYQVQSATP